MSGQLAAATSRSQSLTLRLALMVNSMLLWPEQNQTSPTTTFVKTISAPLPATRNSAPSEFASSGGRLTRHLPSSPTTVDSLRPANETVTRSPGSPLPHTGTGRSRCRTIESPNTCGSVAANARGADCAESAASAATSGIRERNVFICFMWLRGGGGRGGEGGRLVRRGWPRRRRRDRRWRRRKAP